MGRLKRFPGDNGSWLSLRHRGLFPDDLLQDQWYEGRPDVLVNIAVGQAAAQAGIGEGHLFGKEHLFQKGLEVFCQARVEVPAMGLVCQGFQEKGNGRPTVL